MSAFALFVHTSNKQKIVDSVTSPLIGLVGESCCLLRVSSFSSRYIIQKKKQWSSSSQTITSFDMGPYSGRNLQIFKHISFNIDLVFSVWNKKKYQRVHTSRCYNNSNNICTMTEFIFSCNL